jgi:HEAT repeat protein
MTRRLPPRVVALVIALLACAHAAAGPIEAELRWRIGRLASYRPHRLELSALPGEGVDPLKNRTATYGRRPIGNGQLLLCALERESSEVMWIWVDRDLDGDLNDERPVPLTTWDSDLAAEVVIALPLEADSSTVDVPFYFSWEQGLVSKRLMVTIRAHREGRVVLEDRARAILLNDGDGDLRFDPEAGDSVYLDVNGNVRIDREDGTCERIVPGRAFRVGDGGYVMNLHDPTARRITFTGGVEAPPPSGRWVRENVPPSGRNATGSSLTRQEIVRRYAEATEKDLETDSEFTSNRCRAVAAIGRTGAREALAFLQKAYKSEKEINLRVAIVRAMGLRQYTESASRVSSILKSAKQTELRIAAVRALHDMDSSGRDKILAAALRREKQPSVLEVIVENLGFVESKLAYEALEDAFTRLPGTRLRHAAYQAATRFRPSPPSPEFIVRVARSGDARVAALALRDALDQRLPECQALALECAPGARKSVDLANVVVEILGAWGSPKAVAAILPLVQVDSTTLRDRMSALMKPIRDPAAIDVLLAALDSRDVVTRSVVTRALEGISGSAIGVALRRRLAKERHPQNIVALIGAIGRHPSAESIDLIVTVARHHAKNAGIQEVALVALGRLGFSSDAVRGFFESSLAAAGWERRVLILGIAADTEDPGAADLLLAQIAHAAWQVRLMAIQGLGRVRVRRAVIPLVDRLEKEKHQRLKRAIAETLSRITGQSLYDLIELWRRWLKEHGETFSVPDEIPERAPTAGPGGAGGFYGIPVTSDRIVFVIDQSGSMSSPCSGGSGDETASRTALDEAVAQTLGVVRSLAKSALVNIVMFESDIHAWRNKLVTLTNQARASLQRFLADQRPMGGTNLYDGLEMALLMDGVDTIYLLSDGCPGSGKYVETEAILHAVQRLNRTRMITINCVSLGWSSDLLKRLAKQNGGSYAER